MRILPLVFALALLSFALTGCGGSSSKSGSSTTKTKAHTVKVARGFSKAQAKQYEQALSSYHKSMTAVHGQTCKTATCAAQQAADGAKAVAALKVTVTQLAASDFNDECIHSLSGVSQIIQLQGGAWKQIGTDQKAGRAAQVKLGLQATAALDKSFDQKMRGAVTVACGASS